MSLALRPITDPDELEEEFKRQLALLEFGAEEITPREEFLSMLRRSLSTGTPLRVKCGIDPTRTDVHLGHLIPYTKMRDFQNLGHRGVVIVGDYTARIGDPTGRDKSRPPLSEEQVRENGAFYERQLLAILDPDKTEFRRQSEWFEGVDLTQVISWATQTTVAKLLSHETFKKRIDEGHPLGVHELLYPILQGVDSVMVKAHVELGGLDQKFNVLMGRDYQKNAGGRPQCAVLLPLLTGLDGAQKMSSSLDNYIGVDDAPFDMFGKLMSIPDALMPEYFKYLARLPRKEYEEKVKELEGGKTHPKEMKKELAFRVVSLFYGEETAREKSLEFDRVFTQKKIPDEMPTCPYGSKDVLMDILASSGLFASKGEIRRTLSQGGVGFVEGEKMVDPFFVPGPGSDGKVLKIGKRRFLKLKCDLQKK
ncbi:MAG: tyrosine--tRNA ligase [Bacteriovoracales bacterium]|nr:tyrosine--tRNA ligase [Bacteriovoracales bacterium]